MTTTTTQGNTMHDDRILNFSAGPAILPESVLEQLREDIWNINGSGVGVLEHSHRGKEVDTIFEEAIANCKTLAGIDDSHEVLFLQGGASGQFAMLPMNFLHPGRTADYLVTGTWAMPTTGRPIFRRFSWLSHWSCWPGGSSWGCHRTNSRRR